MHGIDAKDAGGTAQGAANRWWALALLTGIYCCHTIDRQVIAVVMEAIKQDLKLSDGYVGFLGGMAHALGFMITVIPLGMLADRVNRVRMLSGLVILWSMLTALGSLVSSAFTLALLRLGVGAAEGGGASTATALVADHFAPRQRGLAFGIFYASTAIGMALVFLFGGMMAHAYGWRAAFLLAGMPGIVMGILTVLTLREPIRGRFDVGGPAPKRASFKAAFRAIRAEPALAWSIAGVTIGSFVVAAVFAWSVSFFGRAHGASIRDAGLILALSIGVIQGLCLPIFGRLNDRLSHGRRDRIHLVTACGLLANVPVELALFLAPSLPLAIAAMLLLGVTTAAWLGQCFGSVVSLSPPEVRGTISGMTQLCTNLLGTGSGPLFAGLLSDALGGGESGLRTALIVVALGNIPAALTLMAATRCLRRTEPTGTAATATA